MITPLAYIPAPPGNQVDVGPFVFHIYGLILGIAVIVALQVGETLCRRRGVRPSGLYSIAIPAIIAGFIGARIYHLISQPVYYWHHPVRALEVWHGGLGIWGAIAAGAGVGTWWAHRKGLRGLLIIDCVAPALALAQAIGRWGNYVNQELFGKPSTLPWALHVDPAYRPAGYADVATFHPTFLYESIWDLALAILLAWLVLRGPRRRSSGFALPGRGTIFACYAALYCVGRFFVERMRIDPAHHFLGLRQNDWVSLGVFAVGAAFAFVLEWRARGQSDSVAI